jgi:hypothetical protein
MKKLYNWIGIGVLCVCLLLVLRYLQTNEPFLANNQCPAGFTLFTDLKGSSFCCKGLVKDKKCTATDKNTFCGLAPNLIDPRTNMPLPTCSKMMDDIAASTSGKYCTKEMPNYVAPGLQSPNSSPTGGCSVAPAIGDGSIFPSEPGKYRLANPYCLISGATDMRSRINDDFYKFGQPSCETLKLIETVKCPATFSPMRGSGGLIYCVSSQAYDPTTKSNSPRECVADEVLALFKDANNNLIGMENAKKLCISCSYYTKRYVEKDTTAKCER